MKAYVDTEPRNFVENNQLTIPLDEEQLFKLKFTKQKCDGSVKYLKGAFRIMLPAKGTLILWIFGIAMKRAYV